MAPDANDHVRVELRWVAEVAAASGFPVVNGLVVRGDGRGRQLGYPTANVALAGEAMLPGDGVYAGTYERPDGTVHAAMIALGSRPTFHADGPRILEAHLLDRDVCLYGEPAIVRFVARIRDQRRFSSPAELVRQISRDASEVRAALASLAATDL